MSEDLDYAKLAPATVLVHAGRHRNKEHRFVNPPIVKGSTVLHESVKDMIEREKSRERMQEDVPTYGIWGTETHLAFYEAMKKLESAAGVWAFPSGLAATTTPLFAFVHAGCHALFMDTIYGPTRDFAEKILAAMGVEVEFFDPYVGADIEKKFKANTTIVVMETPGSHSFELPDVPAIASKCREHGVWSVIDNTWATPLYFQPLKAGVDVVVHAATKYIAGHSDILMGVACCNERAWPKVFAAVTAMGQTATPDDVYLAFRGLHTMKARIESAYAGALKVAAWLQQQPQVEQVLWPPLESHPDHAIFERDFTGGTTLFSVVFKPEYAGRLAPMIDALKIFGRGYSWGGFESLLIPGYGRRTERDSPFDRMVRVAVGLEDPEDLIGDLKQAFARL